MSRLKRARTDRSLESRHSIDRRGRGSARIDGSRPCVLPPPVYRHDILFILSALIFDEYGFLETIRTRGRQHSRNTPRFHRSTVEGQNELIVRGLTRAGRIECRYLVIIIEARRLLLSREYKCICVLTYLLSQRGRHETFAVTGNISPRICTTNMFRRYFFTDNQRDRWDIFPALR